MSLTFAAQSQGPTARQAWNGLALLAAAAFLWMVFGVWPEWLNWLLDGKKAFVSAVLSGVTLAGLYFLVASGFTLVFGLMRNVNLAHGSLYLIVGIDDPVSEPKPQHVGERHVRPDVERPDPLV